ncbi:unnamed protein product, partial [Adineta steineri]
MKTVAIIGGGVSGLICIKCCLDGGLTPVCYEMTNDIGGLWNYDANAVDGKASVMKSTVINTSKEFMAFSDYPPPIIATVFILKQFNKCVIILTTGKKSLLRIYKSSI